MPDILLLLGKLFPCVIFVIYTSIWCWMRCNRSIHQWLFLEVSIPWKGLVVIRSNANLCKPSNVKFRAISVSIASIGCTIKWITKILEVFFCQNINASLMISDVLACYSVTAAYPLSTQMEDRLLTERADLWVVTYLGIAFSQYFAKYGYSNHSSNCLACTDPQMWITKKAYTSFILSFIVII
jgi:uncharacterized membrane protein YbaN (DUF454 family)